VSVPSSQTCIGWILRNHGIIDTEILRNTPRRWVAAFQAQLEPEEFSFTTFPTRADDMIIVSPIQFSSMCSHHLLPFSGVAHVGYIPEGQIAGLSKIARAVQAGCKGLWTQEELTQTIAEELTAKLKPLGVGVIMKAEHTCMTTRGVKALGAMTTTSSMLGVFREKAKVRAEFLSLVGA
jgi:GTP cyclohydrolase IA